ncbi:hypothetical protein OHA72_49215 [Dactylosporangium sp. NBC_01737]|uniref:hypothetical protein n=1 Tax=Dactylosporangium sp. NBC_01737 TaxID=2975959 RepID=UPI002E129476|nr:hypothetical protein OHA72_49215 [Dactylosporangium sp. NBC_01737]
MLLDPGMVTWARVVLLQDRPRRYELVQAYRIMTTVQPQVYRPRLARALGDLVDGFTAAAPADAVEALLAEATTNLLAWARELTRTSPDIVTEVVTRQRRRRALDDGPAWDLLAVAVALEEAGRAGAALTVTQELIAVERGRRAVPRSRLALALIHCAGILRRRERSYDAEPLRNEGLRLLDEPDRPRSNAIAAMLTGTPLPAVARKAPRGVPGTSRTPAASR